MSACAGDDGASGVSAAVIGKTQLPPCQPLEPEIFLLFAKAEAVRSCHRRRSDVII